MKICVRCHRLYTADRTHCDEDGAKLVLDRTKDIVQDRYVLDELIGTGGGGSAVWASTDLLNNTRVALKVLPGRRLNDSNRFRRGASIAVELNHPNIAKVIDFGTMPNEDQFLVMELLYGYDLYQLSLVQPISIERLFNILDQSLAGLEYAHERGVVHRDIKMSNVFVESSIDGADVVKLLDFGIARYVPGTSNEGIGPITGINQLVGTPQYMAPEQAKFLSLDHRVDLYSLGIMTYRLLTGRFPYNGTAKEIFEQHLNSLLPTVATLRPELAPELSPEIENWLSLALEKDRDRRFQTADQMRDALRSLKPTVISRAEITALIEQPPITTVSLEMNPDENRSSMPVGRWASWIALCFVFACLVFSAHELIRPETKSPGVSRLTADTSSSVDLDAAADDLKGQRFVELYSTPGGAEVLQGTMSLGKTPLVVALEPGRHDFIFRLADYKPVHETIIMGARDDNLTRTIIFRKRVTVRKIPILTRSKKGTSSPETSRRAQNPKSIVTKENQSGRLIPAGRVRPAAGSLQPDKIKIQILDEVSEREVKLPHRPINKEQPVIQLLD
ncbi:MAG: serine/threonine-protein kinase [Myxococcota bacterium]|nr:serine/threonine-protein kinase [Myxococcota bacterium]